MRTILLLAAAALLVFVAVPAGAGDAEGAATYSAKCASCHGEDGRGTDAGHRLGVPRLSDDEVQDKSDKVLREVVAHGRNKMPAFEGTLGREGIIDVVIRVRSFWVPKEPATAGNAASR